MVMSVSATDSQPSTQVQPPEGELDKIESLLTELFKATMEQAGQGPAPDQPPSPLFG